LNPEIVNKNVLDLVDNNTPKIAQPIKIKFEVSCFPTVETFYRNALGKRKMMIMLIVTFLNCLSERAPGMMMMMTMLSTLTTRIFPLNEREKNHQNVIFKDSFKHLVVTKKMEQGVVDALLVIFIILPGYK